jgi:predicted adenylyl cyclase CyaB
MAKSYEVELRGGITKDKIKELVKVFRKKGTFKSRKDRILIHFFEDHGDTKALRNLTKDVRVRTTNGVPEIVIKLGKWGGHEHREEFRVTLHKDQFDMLVTIFAQLGFTKGIFAARHGEVYQYKGVEFSLVEVPGHSYYFEAEKMVTGKAGLTKAKKDIEKICAELGLTCFNDRQFHAYIELLNRVSNKRFDFKKYRFGYFKKHFGV